MATDQTVLVLNSGSSSIKFGLYTKADPPRSLISGKIERIGLPQTSLQWLDPATRSTIREDITAPHHRAAAQLLNIWLERRPESAGISAVAHRVVHGGPKYDQPQLVTPDLLAELRRIGPYDPDHFPAQIELISVFGKRSPPLPQVACFDTAFHHNMPRVAKILPLPRKYEAQG